MRTTKENATLTEWCAMYDRLAARDGWGRNYVEDTGGIETYREAYELGESAEDAWAEEALLLGEDDEGIEDE